MQNFSKFLTVQRQLFVGVLQNRCLEEFCKIYRKVPATTSLFLVKLQLTCNFTRKRKPSDVFFCEFYAKVFRTAFLPNTSGKLTDSDKM